jgi:hypothetical protein
VTFGTGNGFVAGQLNINGSPGIYENIGPSYFASWAAFAQYVMPGCGFTVNDLSIIGFSFYTGPGISSQVNIDALAIGKGQNNIP